MSAYTSSYLCHFVGRSKSSDDERFELLITIIKGCQLIANIANPHNLESYFSGGYHCENVGEVFNKCDCVCFCDIPNDALAIHVNKYSCFGMGFDKMFIANQGAHPVMYVPQNSLIVERGDENEKGRSKTPREPQNYFPYLLQLSTSYLPLLEIACMGIDMSKQEEMLKQCGLSNWLDLFYNPVRENVFSGNRIPMMYSILQGIGTQMAYVKLFDPSLPEDHPDNYYMEREWRSLKNIVFSTNDIKTIYLPNSSYQSRFLEEFPDYQGDFYIFDANDIDHTENA